MDVLRIFSALCVIFIHTNEFGFLYFTVARQSRWFPVYLFASILSKTAVPLFFVISGALLLKKEEPISVVLRKRFSRILATLLVCSFVTYLLKGGLESFSLKEFLKKVYATNLATPYWYLYAYLGFLLMLPFLRKLSRLMTTRDYLYMTAIQVGVGLLKVLELLAADYEIHLNSNLGLFITGTAVYYPLMGDFLANKWKRENLSGKRVLLLWGIALLSMALCGWLTCYWCTLRGDWSADTCQRFLNILICLPVAAIFVSARYLFGRLRLRPWLERGIVYVGGHTFGIYLMEWWLRRETEIYCRYLTRWIPVFLAGLIWVLGVFAAGFCLTWILKKIPGLRRIVS